MKKTILLAVAALLAAAVAPSIAGADDARGPACVDILGQDPANPGGGSGGSYQSSGLVTIRLALDGPACPQFEYSVVAITQQSEVPLVRVGANADETLLFFQGSVDAVSNASVCVYAMVSTPGGHHVFDRAPDAGCVVVPRDGSPGFGGFE